MPKQTVGVSLSTLRTMVQNIRTEYKAWKADPTTPVHDLASFTAGNYDIFANLFSPVITDAQWADVVKGFNAVFGNAIYQPSIAKSEFAYADVGLNPIVMINRPWLTAADPTDDASRSFAGIDFAYTTFEADLTKAGTGAGSFGGMLLRDDVSIASKRYVLSEVVNPARSGAIGGGPAMTLVVDGILRAYLGAAFTRETVGKSFGWVVGHELAHNLGLLDEYIYNPFQPVPRDGAANFMSTANVIAVSNRQREALHLAMDNPDTTVNLAGTLALASWYLDVDALDKSNRAGRLALALAPGAGDGSDTSDPLVALMAFLGVKGDDSTPITSSPSLFNGLANAGIVNGSFSVSDTTATDYGWTGLGDAQVVGGVGVLTEDPRRASRLAQTFVVPDQATALSFVIVGANLAANQDGPADAFEVALLDAAGNAVAGALPLGGSDALFNLQTGGRAYAAASVTATGLADRNGGALALGAPITVNVDLSGVSAGSTLTLYFDLLGFGAAASQVSIDNVRIVKAGEVQDLPPVAVADTASVDEDASVLIDVLANDSDPEGKALTLVSAGGATHGVVAVENGQVRYTPVADYFGAANFSYVVRDEAGNSSTATVAVTVIGVNDLPIANPDSAAVVAGGSVLVDVLANDSDPEGTALVLLSAEGASHGSLALESGQVRYTPDAGFAGEDHFTYRIADADGGQAGSLVSVAILVRNSPPVASPDQAVLDEDGTLLIDVLANDSDPEGLAITISSVGAASNGAVAIEDGRIRYTPNANWFGMDSFSYTIRDLVGATATSTVEVLVKSVNDAPTLAAIADAALAEGSTFTVSALGGDVDGGDTLTYALDVAPAAATIDAHTGAISWAATDGDASYDFTVRVTDQAGASAARSFKVDVANVAPTLTVAGLEAVYAGDAYTINLTSSDPGVDTISKWTINWGDGQIVDYVGNPGQLSHGYAGALGRVLISASATDEDGSYALDPLELSVLPVPLTVKSFSHDSNGFALRFNDPFDPGAINLYDSTLAKLGLSDIILSGASSGVVKGSVVFDADYKGLRYIASGSGLLADTYSLTLKSGPSAFHSVFGNLDGNADGIGGDDYVTGFASGAAPALRLSLPDFMRGPGQSVDVPAAGRYLPLTLSSVGDVRNLRFSVRFDPTLMQITGALAGAGLPGGAALAVDTSVAGQITVAIASSTAIAAGKVTLVNLIARVPDTAAYGAVEVVDIGDVVANANSVNAADDDALHVVGYIGDTNRNAKLDRDDVMLILRNAARVDSGFAAWSYISPNMVGDVDGDGRLTTADASRVGQKMNGLLRPEIPDVPTGIPIQFATPLPTFTLPQIDFGTSFTDFTVGSTDPKWQRGNWKKAFVTNMADSTVNPNSSLKVTLDAAVQVTPSV